MQHAAGVCGTGSGFDLITTTDVSESQRAHAAGVTQPSERRRGRVCFSADVIKGAVGCKKPICML